MKAGHSVVLEELTIEPRPANLGVGNRLNHHHVALLLSRARLVLANSICWLVRTWLAT